MPIASWPMRVAIVCPYSCTMFGGVQTQVLGLARALSSRGDDVAVVAPAEGTAPISRLGPAALQGAVFIKVGAGTAVAVNGSRAPRCRRGRQRCHERSRPCATSRLRLSTFTSRSCPGHRSRQSLLGRARLSPLFTVLGPTSPTEPTVTWWEGGLVGSTRSSPCPKRPVPPPGSASAASRTGSGSSPMGWKWTGSPQPVPGLRARRPLCSSAVTNLARG